MARNATKKPTKNTFSSRRVLSRFPSIKKKSTAVLAASGKVVDEETNDVDKEGEATKHPDATEKNAPAAAGAASGGPSDRSASKPDAMAPTLTKGETMASKESFPAAAAAAVPATPTADRFTHRFSSSNGGGFRRLSSLLTLMGSSQNISGRMSVTTPSSLQRLVENTEWDELRDILVNTPDEPPPPPKRKVKQSRSFSRRRSSVSSFSDEEDEEQGGENGMRRPYVDLPKLIEECTDFTGQTLLHDVLRCHPPLDIVTLLVELYPRSLLEVDCMGHSLLHVAAGWGASPQVVEYLSHLNGRMAGKMDCRGKTPLHLMCENLACSSSSNSPNAGETEKKAANGKSRRGSHHRIGLRDVVRSDTGEEQVATEGERKEDGRNNNLVEGPTLGAITALLEVRPAVVISRDRNGMTPIDYARRGNAPREVLDLLRREAARYGADGGSNTVDESSSSESDSDCNDERDGRKRRANRRISSRRVSNRDANTDDSGFAERLAAFMGTSVDVVKAELRTDADDRRRKSERSEKRVSVSDIPSVIEVPLDLTLTREEGVGKDKEAYVLSVGDYRTEKEVRKGLLPYQPDSNGVNANGSEGDDRGNYDDGSDDGSPIQHESHITAKAEHLTLSNEDEMALKEVSQ